MVLDKEQIPKEWLEGLKWSTIEDYQKDFDIKFKEEDLDLFYDALSFGAWVRDQMSDLMLKPQRINMFPGDPLSDSKIQKPDWLPVLGFQGAMPGTILPPEIKKQLPSSNPPNSLRKQEKITSSNGASYNRWDLIEDRASKMKKGMEGTPSCFISKTKFSLHKSNYPPLAIWEFDFQEKGWTAGGARSLTKQLKQKAQKMLAPLIREKRAFWDLQAPTLPSLFLFPPTKENQRFSFAFKGSMAAGVGRVNILSHRKWFRNNEDLLDEKDETDR